MQINERTVQKRIAFGYKSNRPPLLQALADFPEGGFPSRDELFRGLAHGKCQKESLLPFYFSDVRLGDAPGNRVIPLRAAGNGNDIRRFQCVDGPQGHQIGRARTDTDARKRASMDAITSPSVIHGHKDCAVLVADKI